jgi:hypothetical protein
MISDNYDRLSNQKRQHSIYDKYRLFQFLPFFINHLKQLDLRIGVIIYD